MNKGFTLIELLVVVLIIGILSAIALPQYTRAVERARIAEAAQVLGDLATAETLYRLQTNRYATSKARLDTGDIVVPLPGNNWLLNDEDFGDPSNAALTLSRQGGMYDGASLTIELFEDGSIEKTCDDNGHDGFCDLAASFGYYVPTESGEEDDDNRDYLDTSPPTTNTGGGNNSGGGGGFNLA